MDTAQRGPAPKVVMVHEAETSARYQYTTPEVVIILVNQPFEVRWPVTVPFGGRITIEHDPTFLVMQSARLENPTGNPEIVWTFNSLKVGDTKLVITVSGGFTPNELVHTIPIKLVMT
jgi:hypothetical protein